MLTPDEATAVLQRTPAVVGALLRDLPDAWVRFSPGPGEWAAYDVVGHLVHGERTDWVPRLRMILEHGTDRPFVPFDREGMRDSEAPLSELLETFAELRAHSLRDVASMALSGDDAARRGLHPELGEVTLGQMVASWAVHDLSHVAQIAEAMAKRYRDDVGPWRAYLPVLDRESLPD